MAHFLEHLVFKGGENYDDYRRSTRRPSAWAACSTPTRRTTSSPSTSPCAPSRRWRPSTCSPTSSAARRSTPTSSTASAASSSRRSSATRTSRRPSPRSSSTAPRFGDHPLGRTVLGPEEHLRTFTPRRDRRLPRAPLVGRARRRVRRRQPRPRRRQRRASTSSSGASPTSPAPDAFEPAPAFAPRRSSSERDTNQSHLRMSYRPSFDVDRPQASAPRSAIYSTLLGGSMGSRLFDEIREQRGLCYSVYAVDHAYADVPVLQLGAGLESAKAVEAYTRMREIVAELRRRRARPRRRSSARAPTPPAAACWPSRTPTPWRATRPPGDRLRRGHRPRRRHRAARRGHVRRGRARSRARRSRRRSPSRASGPTPSRPTFA